MIPKGVFSNGDVLIHIDGFTDIERKESEKIAEYFKPSYNRAINY
ncbi:hypothetical protein [Bacillus thuringiensis]